MRPFRRSLSFAVIAVGISVAPSIADAQAPAACHYSPGIIEHNCQYPGFGAPNSCHVLCTSPAVNRNASDKAKTSLSLNPPKSPQSPLDHDQLYLVNIKCTHNKGKSLTPWSTSGVLDNKTTLTTHIIEITNSSLTAASLPSASDSSILLIVPVFEIAGAANDVSYFDNTDETCTQSFLVSGRDQPNVVALLSVTDQYTPSQVGNLLYDVISVITPLTPFLGGFGALIKADAPAISNTKSPYANLLSDLDKGATILETGKIRTGAPTTIVTPWTTIEISAAPFSDIRDSTDQSLVSSFEKTFDALSVPVSSPPNGSSIRQICAQIGGRLQFDRNLSREDTAYALMRIGYLSGLNKNGLIECLGSQYGSVAIKLPSWIAAVKASQLPNIAFWEFPPDNPNEVNQPPFEAYVTVYEDLTLALNRFAAKYPNGLQPTDQQSNQAKILADFFEKPSKDQPGFVAIDVTGNTTATASADPGPAQIHGLAHDPLDIISQLIRNGYTAYGCPASDAVTTATAQTAATSKAANTPTNSSAQSTDTQSSDANPTKPTGSTKSPETGSAGPASSGEGAAFAILAFKGDKNSKPAAPSGVAANPGGGAANPVGGAANPGGGAANQVKDKTLNDNIRPYDPNTALVLRFWVDAPIKSSSTPFNRMKISSETNTILSILTADSFRCSADLNISKPQAVAQNSQPPAIPAK